MIKSKLILFAMHRSVITAQQTKTFINKVNNPGFTQLRSPSFEIIDNNIQSVIGVTNRR